MPPFILNEPKEKTYDWDTTDILSSFPEILLLAPDQIGNLNNITEVTMFSDSFCVLEEANVADNDCTIYLLILSCGQRRRFKSTNFRIGFRVV